MNKSQGLDPNRFIDYSRLNYLRKKLQPLLYIKRDSQLSPLLSPEQQSLGFVIKFTSDNRPYFPASKNTKLMGELKGLGFFDVFCTNHAGDDSRAFGVYLSQVSLFLENGITWVRNGFKVIQDSVEIHHLNSNVLDNRVSNIVLVSSVVHSFLSTIQVGRDTVTRCFVNPSFVLYNSNGLVLKGQQAVCKLGWLIHETIKRTKLWLKSVIYCINTPSHGCDISAYSFDVNIMKELNANRGYDVDQLYVESLDTKKEHRVLGMSWNWLLRTKEASLPTILSNLKSAASLFLRNMVCVSMPYQLLSTLSLA